MTNNNDKNICLPPETAFGFFNKYDLTYVKADIIK